MKLIRAKQTQLKKPEYTLSLHHKYAAATPPEIIITHA